jgi:acyl-CoA hydrolase
VDLYSQVNAESNDTIQISGNGGMWDFVLGANGPTAVKALYAWPQPIRIKREI